MIKIFVSCIKYFARFRSFELGECWPPARSDSRATSPRSLALSSVPKFRLSKWLEITNHLEKPIFAQYFGLWHKNNVLQEPFFYLRVKICTPRTFFGSKYKKLCTSRTYTHNLQPIKSYSKKTCSAFFSVPSTSIKIRRTWSRCEA